MIATTESIITKVSLFCGAGGEHGGGRAAFNELGIPPERVRHFALNHWDAAIHTFRRNYDDALCYLADIEHFDGQLTGKDTIEILWASPSCTHHSNARGGKPRENQQRAHATEVFIHWVRPLDISVIIIENVREFLHWGPIGKNGRPIKKKRGKYFRRFIARLVKAGYRVAWRFMKACDYGDPTSRTRLIIQAEKDGYGIHWPKPTHQDPKKPGDLPAWRSAASIIDWSISGKSIFYRKKPLATDTIRRIKHGLKKFGLAPYFASYHGGADAAARVYSTDEPLPTLDTSNRFGIVEPFISKSFGPRCTAPSESVESPLPTITTIDHNHLVEPSLVSFYGAEADRGTGGRDIREPLPSVTAGGNHLGIVDPYIVKTAYSQRGPNRAESLDVPLSTITTKNETCLIEACLIETYADRASKGRGGRDISRPMPTVTCSKNPTLAEPYLVQYNGSSNSQAVTAPLPTVTTDDRFGLVDLVLEHEGSLDTLPIVRTPEDIDAHDFSRPFRIEVDGALYLVEITLRMLAPHELAAAMGFPASFRFEDKDGKPLPKKDQVKMIGNAVPAGLSRAIHLAVTEPRLKLWGLEGKNDLYD